MDFNHLSIDDQVIKNYQKDEQVMIQLFANWCSNNQLDAMQLYANAYPNQEENRSLQKVMNEFNESERIDVPNETMLDILQMFGNYDLAYVVTKEIERLANSNK